MIVNQVQNEYICCICIQSCLISEKDIHTCKICKGGSTIVCGDCITQSLECGQANIFKKCPVCRSENWNIYTPKIKQKKENQEIKCNCQCNLTCNFNKKIVNNFCYILRRIIYIGISFCVGMLAFYLSKGEIFSSENYILLSIILYTIIGCAITLLSIFFIACFSLFLINFYNCLKDNVWVDHNRIIMRA